MNEEGGEGNNRYGLRNRERIDRAGEEVEEEGEEEDDEGEEGRDRQRRRVNEEDPEEEDSDDDGLEVPRDLNLDDDAVADAAANNQGRGGQNRAGAPPRGPAAAEPAIGARARAFGPTTN